MDDVATRTVGDTHVQAVVGDLTRIEVDAVVNAANAGLQHGGGVAGALARAAGPSLQQESDDWVDQHGPLEVGQAAVTGAGDLTARWVVHVAGPVYGKGQPDDESHLRAAVRGALYAAAEVGASTIALPAISAGIYGYPPDEASRVIASEVVRVVDGTGLTEVHLVGLDRQAAELFAAGLEQATGT